MMWHCRRDASAARRCNSQEMDVNRMSRMGLLVISCLMAAAAMAASPGRTAAPAPAPAVQPALPLIIEPPTIDAALKDMVDNKQIVGASALIYQGDREAYF